jgi:KTSC domain
VEWHVVSSSNVNAIAWQAENWRATEYDLAVDAQGAVSSQASAYDTTGTLSVNFHSGRTYTYLRVPESVWLDFLAAPSKGKYLHWKVKPFYQCPEAKS